MSLSTFFADQRRRWYDRTTEYPNEYVAAGWAALGQAEHDFKMRPLLNGFLATEAARQEMVDLHDKYTQTRKKLEKVEPQRLATRQLMQETNRRAQQNKRRIAVTRRALERIREVAGLADFEPEVRLRYIQEMVKQHLALMQAEEAENKLPQLDAQ